MSSPPATTRPEPEELAAWLQLLGTPGVGRVTARRLLAAFGSPQAVLAASMAARREVVGAAVAQALDTLSDELAEQIRRTEGWLAEPVDAPRAVLVLGDPLYPDRLLQSPDPPLLLYACGQLDRLKQPGLAVVGSRNPSPQGAENARVFACALSQAGLTVVSGLALGIDAAAHEGALLGPAGTIAVVGTGLDRVYPRQHRELAHRIAGNGLLLSEFPLGTGPLAAHFPQRNRIIAGLALGTLVVEATLQSGSLISARLAVEAGREVFAIPGSIHNPQARGCHALIRQGAKLVESTQDILEELQLAAPALPAASTAPEVGVRSPAVTVEPMAAADESDPLLQALGFGPATLDALEARTGLAAAELLVQLLQLELAGQVDRLPGQLFRRCQGVT
jgi:DNA processing protein